MVSFYKPGKGKSAKRGASAKSQLTIDDWDWKGQGVVRGKTVRFISGALPQERCDVNITHTKRQVAEGHVIKVIAPNEARQLPFCPVAGACGGCQLQHVASDAALTWRQQAINQLLHRAIDSDADDHVFNWQPAITGPKPGYRRKARLAIDARNPDKVSIGYRAQRDNRVVDIETCPVLVPQLASLIAPLKSELLRHPGIRHIGHIGLLAGDTVSQVTIKMTRPLSAELKEALTDFATSQSVNMLIESAQGEISTLYQHAPVHCTVVGKRYLAPGPNDFIQVNDTVNQAMIRQALAWLDVQPGEVVADWYCGLGNFSLALADSGAHVQAIEGVAEMVQRAQANAQAQGIDTIDWQHLDLNDYETVRRALSSDIQKVLLDPSREGAAVVCTALTERPVERILYVSCNPSTLSRDAGTLTRGGYQLEKVSLIEMFPFTQHLEMMALFTHSATKKHE